MLHFRHVGGAIVALVLSTFIISPGRANAQSYPANKITLIVAFAPGGVADTLARLLAQGMTERLHQTVVVENRGGAGGNIAAAAVVRAAPDGTTLLVTTTALAINETLHETRQFAMSDLKTVAVGASSPESLLTSADNPAATLATSSRTPRRKGRPSPSAPPASAAARTSKRNISSRCSPRCRPRMCRFRAARPR